MGWVVNVTPRPHLTPGKDPVPIEQEAGWTPGLVRTGAENLAPTRVRPAVTSRNTDRTIPTRLLSVNEYVTQRSMFRFNGVKFTQRDSFT